MHYRSGLSFHENSRSTMTVNGWLREKMMTDVSNRTVSLEYSSPSFVSRFPYSVLYLISNGESVLS